MFNRLAAVRIKAAEDALAAARLSEALNTLLEPEVAQGRRAQEIMAELGRRFVERGQDRLLSQRFQDALADFEQAARCGVPKAPLEEWRRRAQIAMQEDAEVRKAKNAALGEARQRLTAGSIAGAMDALARAPIQDAEGVAVAENIKRQSERAAHEVEGAKRAFESGHIEAAAGHLRRARDLHSKVEGLIALEADLVAHVVAKGRDLFREGRIDRVEQELRLLADIGATDPDRVELQEAMRLAREASRAASQHKYDQAGLLLGRILQLEPKAQWVGSARKQLDDIENNRRSMMEGPLGVLIGDQSSERNDRAFPSETMRAAPPVIKRPGRGDAVFPGRRLILRIDGVGSFLLLRGDRISIGRSGGQGPADLDLISDLSERHAEIVRAGEDYFLVSMAGVELAGRPVEHALLQDGDRIRLGPRVKLRFGKPSLRSPAAFLDLADGVRTTNDCRRVILWDGPLLLGNTRECHISIRSAAAPSILVQRDGQFLLRPMGLGGPASPIVIGQATEFGELRLSLQDASRSSVIGEVFG